MNGPTKYIFVGTVNAGIKIILPGDLRGFLLIFNHVVWSETKWWVVMWDFYHLTVKFFSLKPEWPHWTLSALSRPWHSEAVWWGRLSFFVTWWGGEDVSLLPSPSLNLMVFHVEADAEVVVVNIVQWEGMGVKMQLIRMVHEHLEWKDGEQHRSGERENPSITLHPKTLFDVMHFPVTLLGHNAGNFSFLPLRSPDFTNHSL